MGIQNSLWNSSFFFFGSAFTIKSKFSEKLLENDCDAKFEAIGKGYRRISIQNLALNL